MLDDCSWDMTGYIPKYGFHCLEKGLTRLEAERTFQLDPELPQADNINGYVEIIRLADWDKMISRPFAKYAISYLLNCKNEKLPKETVVSFEM